MQRLSRRKEAAHEVQSGYWEELWAEEEMFNSDLYYMDDVTRYRIFGQHKEVFETKSFGDDGFAEHYRGEDFGTWGRRRINEMRAVKEARLERKLAGIDEEAYNKSRIKATTLPTTQLDIEGHHLLRGVLEVNKYMRNYLRSKNQPPFRTIISFQWFGEYVWQWHRNLSGCWEIGFGAVCEDGYDYPCYCGNIVRCDYDFNGCSCPKFRRDEKSPEDTQECSLVEWVKGNLFVMMVEEERTSQQKKEYNNEAWKAGLEKLAGSYNGPSDGDSNDWEVLSHGVSDSWSVVSSIDDFEVV
jgi:hypothetical protein